MRRNFPGKLLICGLLLFALIGCHEQEFEEVPVMEDPQDAQESAEDYYDKDLYFFLDEDEIVDIRDPLQRDIPQEKKDALLAILDTWIEDLSDTDLLPLFEAGRREVEELYSYPEISLGENGTARGLSPVQDFDMIYAGYGEYSFENDYGNIALSYLVTQEEVFGVKPGEPLENFREAFGDIDIHASRFYNREDMTWFSQVRKGHLRYFIHSADAGEPVYRSFSVTYDYLIPNPEETDPYLRLVGRLESDLDAEDYRLILSTSVEELEEIYDIHPLEIPEEEVDLLLFKLYSNIQSMPIQNTRFRYHDTDRSLPPVYVEVRSDTARISDVYLGTTFGDIENLWGPGEKRLYRNPMGNSAVYWQAVDYHRDGLVYSFRCMESFYIWDYGIDHMEPLPEDLPWDEFPQRVTRVLISIDDDSYYFNHGL